MDEYCGVRFGGTSEVIGYTDIVNVNSMCSLGDGRLASSSDDKTIRIWDLSEGGECVQTLNCHTGVVNSACALIDDRLASGSRDESLRIWC